jgi:hypothetical protein
MKTDPVCQLTFAPQRPRRGSRPQAKHVDLPDSPSIQIVRKRLLRLVVKPEDENKSSACGIKKAGRVDSTGLPEVAPFY